MAADDPEAKPAGRQNVTLDRGLDILELFLDSTTPLSVGEIGARLGMPQSSVYRIVRPMRDRQWLAVEPGGLYRLGPRLLTAASRAESENSLLSAAGPILQRLTDVTNETSLLTVASGVHAVCLLRFEGAQTVRVSFQPGAILPLHAGASSTALLAFGGKELIDRVCAGPLTRYSPATVVDPDRLRTMLARVREKGYAYSEGEVDGGVAAVGVPVIPVEGRPAVGALSVVAPSDRLRRSQAPETATVVIEAARELAAQLVASR